jgi:hypothetical protein
MGRRDRLVTCERRLHRVGVVRVRQEEQHDPVGERVPAFSDVLDLLEHVRTLLFDQRLPLGVDRHADRPTARAARCVGAPPRPLTRAFFKTDGERGSCRRKWAIRGGAVGPL